MFHADRNMAPDASASLERELARHDPLVTDATDDD